MCGREMQTVIHVNFRHFAVHGKTVESSVSGQVHFVKGNILITELRNIYIQAQQVFFTVDPPRDIGEIETFEVLVEDVQVRIHSSGGEHKTEPFLREFMGIGLDITGIIPVKEFLESGW